MYIFIRDMNHESHLPSQDQFASLKWCTDDEYILMFVPVGL